ncbi:MAG: hypothetical protein ABI882_16270, partial [Acidobacteriota bacterium]
MVRRLGSSPRCGLRLWGADTQGVALSYWIAAPFGAWHHFVLQSAYRRKRARRGGANPQRKFGEVA